MMRPLLRTVSTWTFMLHMVPHVAARAVLAERATPRGHPICAPQQNQNVREQLPVALRTYRTGGSSRGPGKPQGKKAYMVASVKRF